MCVFPNLRHRSICSAASSYSQRKKSLYMAGTMNIAQVFGHTINCHVNRVWEDFCKYQSRNIKLHKIYNCK